MKNQITSTRADCIRSNRVSSNEKEANSNPNPVIIRGQKYARGVIGAKNKEFSFL
jgi:hypothetical protein